jgi:menaquinone-dependent protoporphyrinogen oxidase
VLYGTTESQTAKIAQHIADTISRHGSAVDVFNAAHLPQGFSLYHYDAAIIGASMHAGGYQRTVIAFVKRQRVQLNRMPAAFFSVSLTEAYPTAAERARLKSYVARFYQITGWRPKTFASFAGALAYSHYHGLKRWAMLWIARTVHAPTDTSRDYEYTDWGAVERFAAAFVQTVSPSAVAKSR